MNRLSSASGVVVLLISSLSIAQEQPPPPPPPPPAAVEAAPVPPPPPPPLANDEPEDAPVRDDPGMRLRFGASAGGGTFFPGPMVNFGVEGRVGWQFTNMLGAYFVIGRTQGLWFGGNFATGAGGTRVGVNVGFLGYTHFGFEGEVILGNRFFVAAGPQIVNGGWGFVGQSASGGSGGGSASQSAGVVSGWLPAVGTKIGIGFGRPNPKTGRRSGFTMMLDTLFMYGQGGVQVSQSGGGGSGGAGASQIIAPLGGLGITPMLMFGFESR